MKKMSKIESNEFGVFGCTNGDFSIRGFNLDLVQEAVHAINHVDALAEALEAILDSYESQQLRDSLLDNAKEALAAYRGFDLQPESIKLK